MITNKIPDALTRMFRKYDATERGLATRECSLQRYHWTFIRLEPVSPRLRHFPDCQSCDNPGNDEGGLARV